MNMIPMTLTRDIALLKQVQNLQKETKEMKKEIEKLKREIKEIQKCR